MASQLADLFGGVSLGAPSAAPSANAASGPSGFGGPLGHGDGYAGYSDGTVNDGKPNGAPVMGFGGIPRSHAPVAAINTMGGIYAGGGGGGGLAGQQRAAVKPGTKPAFNPLLAVGAVAALLYFGT